MRRAHGAGRRRQPRTCILWGKPSSSPDPHAALSVSACERLNKVVVARGRDPARAGIRGACTNGSAGIGVRVANRDARRGDGGVEAGTVGR